jgi:hypothetical protein
VSPGVTMWVRISLFIISAIISLSKMGVMLI